jgi:predicted RNA-binding Zn-ribbon protein involved in translation (DUF1610 family)
MVIFFLLLTSYFSPLTSHFSLLTLRGIRLTDLERFFRQLVRNLAATDPARLRRPLPLTDIRDSILPYRANRRALELESSEDYELILMQLCAGEGGFAATQPPDIKALFAAELRSPNPDLGMLHLHENAEVSLEPKRVADALDPKPELAFAPPGHLPDVLVDESPVSTLTDLEPREPSRSASPHPEAAVHCSTCGEVLPGHRMVNFCPQCGSSQIRTGCPACGSEVEAGWRHCVTCGAAVSD